MTTSATQPNADIMDWMPAQIEMPYTLTPGQAAGIFLAELGRRRLIGSRHGDALLVPAQDFDGRTGEPADGFVEVTPVGTVQAFTRTDRGTLGLVLVDGSETPFLHRLVGFGDEGPQVGARVQAVWADNPTGSVLDLEGFGPLRQDDAIPSEPSDRESAEPVQQVDTTMTLNYRHAYGPYYGTFFDAVKHDRRLRGVRCTECARVLLPPRAICDVCYAPTAQWVDVPGTGTVQACSVVHIEFIGQRLKPPYVYAEIVLDGSSTRLIHMVGGIDPEAARTAVRPGSRVRPVWSERRTGSLADIEYFELVEGEGA